MASNDRPSSGKWEDRSEPFSCRSGPELGGMRPSHLPRWTPRMTAKSTWTPQRRFQGSVAALMPLLVCPPLSWFWSSPKSPVLAFLFPSARLQPLGSAPLSFQKTLPLRPLSYPLLFLPSKPDCKVGFPEVSAALRKGTDSLPELEHQFSLPVLNTGR